jgi:hypothetical protein
MGKVKSRFLDIDEKSYGTYAPQDLEGLAQPEPQPEPQGRKMYLLLCSGKPLALYDHRDTADYEMHICKQGDAHEGIEHTYRIKTMSVVTHAYEEN